MTTALRISTLIVLLAIFGAIMHLAELAYEWRPAVTTINHTEITAEWVEMGDD